MVDRAETFFARIKSKQYLKAHKKARIIHPGLLIVKKDGVNLLSRNRSTIGRCGLTSVFGMGTGITRSELDTVTPDLCFSAQTEGKPNHKVVFNRLEYFLIASNKV